MQTGTPTKSLPLKDQVYWTIRGKLRFGELGVEDRLVDKDIAQALNISRTPVREALQLLAHERLLEATSRGFRLGNLNQKEAGDLYEVRLLLEPQVARNAANNTNKSQARALSNSVKSARAAVAPDQLDQFNTVTYSFFEQLLAMCDNQAMVRSVQLYHDRLAQMRVMMMASPKNRRLAVRGFSAIAKAIAANDADAAECASAMHIRAGIEICTSLGLIAAD